MFGNPPSVESKTVGKTTEESEEGEEAHAEEKHTGYEEPSPEHLVVTIGAHIGGFPVTTTIKSETSFLFKILTPLSTHSLKI